MTTSPPSKHGETGVVSDEDDYSLNSDSATHHLLEKEKEFGMENSRDLESQQRLPTKDTDSGKQGEEYSVAPRKKYLYLGLYFGLNLSLTLFNKAVLGKVCTVSPPLASPH